MTLTNNCLEGWYGQVFRLFVPIFCKDSLARNCETTQYSSAKLCQPKQNIAARMCRDTARGKVANRQSVPNFVQIKILMLLRALSFDFFVVLDGDFFLNFCCFVMVIILLLSMRSSLSLLLLVWLFLPKVFVACCQVAPVTASSRTLTELSPT